MQKEPHANLESNMSSSCRLCFVYFSGNVILLNPVVENWKLLKLNRIFHYVILVKIF